MSVVEEDPFFRSLSALKELLFSGHGEPSPNPTAAAASPLAVAPPDAVEPAHSLQERVLQLERQLKEAMEAVEKEKSLRMSLNQAFLQLTEHNRQVTEELASVEASKVSLQDKIRQLNADVEKEQAEHMSIQKAWETEKHQLVENREQALKDRDSWEARFASKERHVQELQEKCDILKREFESSLNAERDSHAHSKSELNELKQSLNVALEECGKLRNELLASQKTADLRQMGLEALKQSLPMVSMPSTAGDGGNPSLDQSDDIDTEVNRLKEIGNFVEKLLDGESVTKALIEEFLAWANAEGEERQKRKEITEQNEKKRHLPEDTAKDSDSKRLALEADVVLEADV